MVVVLWISTLGSRIMLGRKNLLLMESIAPYSRPSELPPSRHDLEMLLFRSIPFGNAIYGYTLHGDVAFHERSQLDPRTFPVRTLCRGS